MGTTISAAGQVTVRDRCTREQIMRWRFPPTGDEKTATVIFRLKPSSK